MHLFSKSMGLIFTLVSLSIMKYHFRNVLPSKDILNKHLLNEEPSQPNIS